MTPRVVELKRCSKCACRKPLEAFYADKRTGDGKHSWCKDCVLVAARDRYKRDPEPAKTASRERYAQDPDAWMATAEQRRKAHPQRNAEVQRRATIKRRYGITIEQYDEMSAAQGHRCAICQRSPRRLCVDHRHDTQAVRGLLCLNCNSGLGLLGDDEAGLQAALDYLRSR